MPSSFDPDPAVPVFASDPAGPVVPVSPRTGLPLIPKGAAERTRRCDDPPPEGLMAGIDQFNHGDYWDCHETLEELWRGEPDPVRYLYQGILQAGVGLYHLRRGNRRGALSKLRAARARLAPYAPACMGVDVAALRADLARILIHLDDRAPDDRAPDDRAPDDRAPDDRAPDDRAPDAPVSLTPELAPVIRVGYGRQARD